jgi:hypothetical protein
MISANRAMVKMIHADGFFPPNEVAACVAMVNGLRFSEKSYGYELENINMVLNKLEPMLSRVLGERIVIDHKRSGIFRKPFNNVIHYEDFQGLNEWCFIVALEKNTLNLYHHVSGGEIDAETALDGSGFNYQNLFEWDLHTNVLMEPNHGVFIRPWVFHSLDNCLVQYYRLISDRKFRVLVMGTPGSSRKKAVELLAQQFESTVILDSMTIRRTSKDIDYTAPGRMRQTYRLLSMARNANDGDVVLINSVCPLAEQREVLNADLVFWIADGKDAFHEFNEPEMYDGKYQIINDEAIYDMLQKIKAKRIHL